MKMLKQLATAQNDVKANDKFSKAAQDIRMCEVSDKSGSGVDLPLFLLSVF